MKVRRDKGYEGEVFYFLDCKDNVIGLLKKKTAWYVVLRLVQRWPTKWALGYVNSEALFTVNSNLQKSYKSDITKGL